MDFTFPWPMSQGEWLAWSAALVTLLIGLLTLFAPGIVLRARRLQTRPDRPEAVAEIRATFAGFPLGAGLAAMLLAQPLLYLALGLAWSLSAFGRIVSMMSDRANTAYNWIALVFELALALATLLYALGLVP